MSCYSDFDAARNSSLRRRDRRRSARSHTLAGLAGTRLSAGLSAWALVERLEERTLLAGPTLKLGVLALPLSQYNEGDPPALVAASDALVTAGDSGLTNFNGGTLSFAVSKNNTSFDHLAVVPGQKITVDAAGIVVSYDGKQIATITSNGDGTNPLLFSLDTTDADPTAVTALLRQVSYSNTANAPAASVEITVTLTDGNALDSPAAEKTTVQIIPVNDAPVFTVGSNVTVKEDSGAHSAVQVTGIDDGDPEVAQSLTFNVSNGNNALFLVQPAISPTGVLTFTPADNANGSALVTVTLTDDDTAGGAAITTASQTFTITVTPINDAPVFTVGSNVTVKEDSGAHSAVQVTGIDDGDPEVAQSLTFNVSNGNNALFLVQPAISPTGVLTFTPADNANGSALVTVTLTDDDTAGGAAITTASQTFTITVTPINDAPVFTVGSNVTVKEDSGAHSAVQVTGIDDGDPEVAQSLTFNVSNGNNALFLVQPAISPTGVLTFTPADNANGSALVTVTLTDDDTAGGAAITTASQTFTITVTPVNDAPTLDQPSSFSINQNAPPTTITLTGITPGPTDELPQHVTISHVVLPGATVAGTIDIKPSSLSGPYPAQASLTFTPATNSFGTMTIRVTVQDNGGTANGGVNSFFRDFVVSVGAVNQPPGITVPPSPQELPANNMLIFKSDLIDPLKSNPISVSDVDAGETPQVTLTVVRGTLEVVNNLGNLAITGNNTANVVISGSVTNLNAGLQGLTYRASAGTTGDLLTVKINDRFGQPDDLSATATVSIGVNVADLQVMLAAAPVQGTVFLVGLASEYMITVTNHGPSPATNLVVTDAFTDSAAANLAFKTTTVTIPGVTLTRGTDYTTSEGGTSAQVVFKRPLGPGETATIVVTATPGLAGNLLSTVTTAHPELDDDTAPHPNSALRTDLVQDAGLVGFNKPSAAGPNNDTPTVVFVDEGGTSYHDYQVRVDRLKGTFGKVGFNVRILSGNADDARIGPYQGILQPPDLVSQYEILVPSSDGANPKEQVITSVSTFQLYFDPGVAAQDVTIRVWRSPYITSDVHVRLQISDLSSAGFAVDPNNGARLDNAKANSDFVIQNVNSFVVTTSDDNVPGSLRNIVDLASKSPQSDGSPNLITFKPGITTVTLNAGLPIDTPVKIDGGASGVTIIPFSSSVTAGLQLNSRAAKSVLTRLTLKDFIGDTIIVMADNVSVLSNTIFASAQSSTGSGVHLKANKALLTGNTFQSNTHVAVFIDGKASGNRIGEVGHPTNTFVDNGTAIAIVGGAAATDERPSGNFIVGNSISGSKGTSSPTSLDQGYGVYIFNSPHNTIGVTADPGGGASSNYIWGNKTAGVCIGGQFSINNAVSFNSIGLNASDKPAGPNNITQPIGIQISDFVDTTTVPPVVVVSGVKLGNNVISGNSGDGILLAKVSGVTLTANKIGTDHLGNALPPTTTYPGTPDPVIVTTTNNAIGVHLVNAPANIIGGATDTQIDRNVISGNKGDGILVESASKNNIIQNNYIGLAASGLAEVPNVGNGIWVDNVESDGTGALAFQILSNVVSGNGGAGIMLSGGTKNVLLAGNKVGLNAAGTSAVANAKNGVHIKDSPSNTIGGATIDARNVISGNKGDGILVESLTTAGASKNTVIQFNFIGLDGNGGKAVTGGGNGIHVKNVVSDATGNEPKFKIVGNYVSGNLSDGILLDVGTSVALVAGNKVGLNAAGTGPVPNGANGIHLVQTTNIQVGGPAGNRNVVSGNAQSGVVVERTVMASTATSRDENVIQFNWIGVDTNGSLPVGNTQDGVRLDASTGTVVHDNVIAASTRGNGINASNAHAPVITRNWIGAGDKHTEILGNALSGVLIDATSGAIIGGTRADTNTIVNNRVGVTVQGNPSVEVPSNAKILNNDIGIVKHTTDLQLTAWGDGTNVPTSGINTVLLGIDTGGLLHIRIFNAAGIRVTDADETKLPGMQAGAISTLKQQLPGLLPPHDLTGGEKAQIFALVSSIVGQTFPVTITLARGNIDAGVRISQAKGVIVESNVIESNLGNGVHLVEADTATIGGVSEDNANYINNNGKNGVEVEGKTQFVKVQWNTIGADGVTTFGEGNAQDGVRITGVSLPDSATAGTRSITVAQNTIVRNSGNGVQVMGGTTNGVFIEDNGIGTRAGANLSAPIPETSLGNRLDGVLISASTEVFVRRNIILGNQASGVELTASASSNKIGEVEADRNTIVFNTGHGVLLTRGASNNTVAWNTVGNSQDWSTDLGNIGNGVAIVSQAGSGPVKGNTIAHNRIAGNRNSGVLLSGAQAESNTLSGNTIGGLASESKPAVPLSNRSNGISVLDAGVGNTIGGRDSGDANTIIFNINNGILISGTGGTKVQGNNIGTDGVETKDSGNGNTNVGVFLLNSYNTEISNNVVSGNKSYGVLVAGGTEQGGNNTLYENFIGVTRLYQRLSNSLAGVLLLNAMGNTIGSAGKGNVISANQSHGVFIVQGDGTATPPGNKIQGNWIGTDKSLSDGLGNTGDGVVIVDSSGNLIGGPNELDRNVISSNALSGVEILGNSHSNIVIKNIIGTDKPDRALDQPRPLGNKLHGVLVASHANEDVLDANVIDANVIGGNLGHGVFVDTSNNTTIANNEIGGTKTGDDLANGLNGISLNKARSIRISTNTVAHNKVDGIGLLESASNWLAGNTVYSNAGDGIRVEEASTNNQIGVASTHATPNYIYGNKRYGVEIRTRSTGNTVVNNWVGLDATKAPSSNQVGVLLNNVSGNTVGGAALGDGSANTVSGNTTAGIQVTGNNADSPKAGNLVQNNFVGTSPSGEQLDTLPASSEEVRVGVLVINSQANSIVGNLTSGNATAGIEIFGSVSTNNQVRDNIVGSNKRQDRAGRRLGAGPPQHLHGARPLRPEPAGVRHLDQRRGRQRRRAE